MFHVSITVFKKKIALQTVWQEDKQIKETERQEERRERERKEDVSKMGCIHTHTFSEVTYDQVW